MNADHLPEIGITFGPREQRETEAEYIEALEQTGARVKALRRFDPKELSALDGLVLSGGVDLHPRHYGEPIRYDCVEVDEARDAYELQLVREALKRDLPVFAICRGVQVLNVAAGGTLHQDLVGDLEGPLEPAHAEYRGCPDRSARRRLRHEVVVEGGSPRLSRILGTDYLEVNSRHHQAIKEVAPGFRVTARSGDGVVEAIESERHRWVVGVQWHPEAREVCERFRALFSAFVEACRSPRAVP